MFLLHRYIIYYYYAKLQDYSQYYDNNDNYIDYSNNYCYCYCCCYTIAKKTFTPATTAIAVITIGAAATTTALLV